MRDDNVHQFPEDRRRKLAAEVDEIQCRQAAAEIEESFNAITRASAQLAFGVEVPSCLSPSEARSIVRAKLHAATCLLNLATEALAEAMTVLSEEEYRDAEVAKLRRQAEPGPAA